MRYKHFLLKEYIFELRSHSTILLPNHLANMLVMQDKLTKMSQDMLMSSDAAHLSQTASTITEFEIDNHLLVANLLRILNRNKSKYFLLDLVLGKERRFHVKNMRLFEFNKSKVDPLDMARHDHDEFIKIIAHKRDFEKVLTLSFLVCQLSYSADHHCSEPWANLRDSEQLQAYLHSIGKSRAIPRQK